MAGVDKEARWAVESIVRKSLGSRSASEDWMVSLVKLGDKWSVTLHGPQERLRDVSLMATENRLGEAIRDAIDGGGAAPAAEPHVVERSGQVPTETNERCPCERCGQTIVVVYESQPNEPKEEVAVACPHCWAINRVEIGSWAASGHDYRADKG